MWTAWLLLTLNGLFFTLRMAGTTGSFPRALKREEEQKLLRLCAKGCRELIALEKKVLGELV